MSELNDVWDSNEDDFASGYEPDDVPEDDPFDYIPDGITDAEQYFAEIQKLNAKWMKFAETHGIEPAPLF